MLYIPLIEVIINGIWWAAQYMTGAWMATEDTEHFGTHRLRLKSPQGREKDLHEKLTLVCGYVSGSQCVYVKVNVGERMR